MDTSQLCIELVCCERSASSRVRCGHLGFRQSVTPSCLYILPLVLEYGYSIQLDYSSQYAYSMLSCIRTATLVLLLAVVVVVLCSRPPGSRRLCHFTMIPPGVLPGGCIQARGTGSPRRLPTKNLTKSMPIYVRILHKVDQIFRVRVPAVRETLS